MSKILCIYKPDDPDILGATWAVHQALGNNVEFIAAPDSIVPFHGSVRESRSWRLDLRGRDILIVGVDYPMEDLHAMAAEARGICIFGKSARSLSLPLDWGTGDEWSKLCGYYVPSKSLAGLSWDYFHIDQSRPRIIDLIDDYALGPRHSPGGSTDSGNETEAFHAVLMSYDLTDLPAMFKLLDNWLELDWFKGNPKFPGGLAFNTYVLAEGHAILRSQRQAVKCWISGDKKLDLNGISQIEMEAFQRGRAAGKNEAAAELKYGSFDAKVQAKTREYVLKEILQWQTIETAPKDGTKILLLGNPQFIRDDYGRLTKEKTRAIEVGWWEPEGDSWTDENGIPCTAGSGSIQVTGCWFAGGGWFQTNEVSHWMPLPELLE